MCPQSGLRIYKLVGSRKKAAIFQAVSKMLLRAKSVPTQHFPLCERRIGQRALCSYTCHALSGPYKDSSYYCNDQNFKNKVIDFICDYLQSSKF